MLRIDVDASPDRTARIVVAGALTHDGVEALRRTLTERTADGRPVVLDFAQVTGIDRAGVELLATVTADGVRLRRAGRFVRVWLAAERRARRIA